MPVSLPALVADLDAETADLLALVAPLAGDDWEQSTPAEGWAIRDQVGHLAFFDDAAARALVDPDGFRAGLVDAGEVVERAVVDARHLAAPDLLSWFTDARQRLLVAFAAADPSARLPWYGPDMSVASSVTARLMETWAHGQDIADALGHERTPTARLRHIAHLGVATRGHSYRVRGREEPSAPVHVALDAPDGGTWTWGDPGAPDRVTGPALDLCLVVTQRRHLDATSLETTPGARDWLRIAQAFAGAPGPGRTP